MGNDPMMRKFICATVLAAWAVAAPYTADADPTPQPAPGYQIAGPSGPAFPGVQVYPPRCIAAMLACGFEYQPDTGTWQPGTG